MDISNACAFNHLCILEGSQDHRDLRIKAHLLTVATKGEYRWGVKLLSHIQAKGLFALQNKEKIQ